MITTLLFIVLLMLSAFFSSAETAFFSLSSVQRRMMQQERYFAAHLVQKLGARMDHLLVVILIGNNIVNLFTASYATVTVARFFDSAALGIATGVTTIAILIFGEIIPKSFAYAYNMRIASIVAWPLYIFSILVTPIAWLFEQLMRLAQSSVGTGDGGKESVTEEEVKTLSRLGVEHGALDYREHAMIENVLEMQDATIETVMTPWYRVTTLNGTVPVEQIAYFVAHEGHSRYPVHDGSNSERIVGYVRMGTILRILKSDQRDQQLLDFIDPLPQVPESYDIDRVFRAMVKKRTHLFLVHDAEDQSLVTGIVTLEDLIEHVLGDIDDEDDV